jgi:aerobic carbon-monoxide dehydrogenase large subunit
MASSPVKRNSPQFGSLKRFLEIGLYEVASFSPDVSNFLNGCHVCEVEIDPETGATRVLRYVVVDDVAPSSTS